MRRIVKKSGKCTVNDSNYSSFCIGIFKALSDINTSFVKDIFQLKMTNRLTQEKNKPNLEIIKSNQTRFGTKVSRYLGPKVWNSLPYNIKLSENLTIFKNLVKKWNVTVCTCNICQK